MLAGCSLCRYAIARRVERRRLGPGVHNFDCSKARTKAVQLESRGRLVRKWGLPADRQERLAETGVNMRCHLSFGSD